MPGVWSDLERLVARCGVDWTFVRAGGFAMNTLGWVDQVRRGDVVRAAYPEGGRSLVHERDIADVVVRTLTEPGHAGLAYTVTGPEVLTEAEQVRAIGDALGRSLRIEQQPATRRGRSPSGPASTEPTSWPSRRAEVDAGRIMLEEDFRLIARRQLTNRAGW